MKRVLYLRVEVEAPKDSDPMLDLSDAALWAELRLRSNGINSTVTAYNNAQDIALDEAEGICDNKPQGAPRRGL